jgi:hypothetical protein
MNALVQERSASAGQQILLTMTSTLLAAIKTSVN